MRNIINKRLNEDIDDCIDTLQALDDWITDETNLAVLIAIDKERGDYQDKLQNILNNVTKH